MNSILLLHDLDGPDASAAHFAARLQEMGYATVVPELFTAPAGQDEAALLDWASTLVDADVLQRAQAAFTQIAAEGARVAVCGLGWGGTYALLLAAHEPRVAATVDIGGTITYPVWTAKRPGSPLNFVAGLTAPFLAAFPAQGAAQSPDEIARLRSRLIEHDKAGEVKIYDAKPNFWREDSEAARSLLKRVQAFLSNAFDPQPLSPNPQQIRPETGYPNEASRIHA